MKSIKSLVLGVALGLGLGFSAVTAKADQYRLLSTLVSNGVITTNASSVGVTSNYTSYAGVTKYQEINLTIRFKLQNSASNDNTVWNWTTANDTNYPASTGLKGSITIPANGTGWAVMSTNIYVGSAGYFSLTNAVGSTNGVVTNSYAEIWVKPTRNGS